MEEFLPCLLGCGIAFAFTGSSRRIRPASALACVLGGASASAINGELSGPLWALFVSFDAALVWIGAAVTTAILWSVRRRPTAG
jgi:hypothetical protein